MPRINELSQAQEEILNRLFFLDSEDQDDEAEIARLKKDLLMIRENAYGTLQFLSGILLESKALLEGREEVKRRAERRRKTAENSVIRLTSVIEFILKKFEIQKIDLKFQRFDL